MGFIFELERRQRDRLSELVSALQRAEALIASAQGMREGLLAMASLLAEEIAGPRNMSDPAGEEADLATRTVATQIAAALRLNDRSVQAQMRAASSLVEDFPRTYRALCAGRITSAHARILTGESAGITAPEALDRYESDALTIAEDESPGRLRAAARRIAQRHQPRSLDERHHDARALRHLSMYDSRDGMSVLAATLPSAIAHGIYDRLTQMAHAVRRDDNRALRKSRNAGGTAGAAGGTAGAAGVPGTAAETGSTGALTVTGSADAADARASLPGTRGTDMRTVDEIRADLFGELLLTGAPEAHDSPERMLKDIRGRVGVTVPVFTLMDLAPDDATERIAARRAGAGLAPGDHLVPAELNGTQPIDTRTARILARHASGWDRILTHPVTARVLTVDRYRPGKELRRYLHARDAHCRFLACNFLSWKGDIDHTEDAARGGSTSHDNLGALCRRHHVTKHQTPWKLTQLPGGLFEWTSPTGVVYIDKPPIANTVALRPVDDTTKTTAPNRPATIKPAPNKTAPIKPTPDKPAPKNPPPLATPAKESAPF